MNKCKQPRQQQSLIFLSFITRTSLTAYRHHAAIAPCKRACGAAQGNAPRRGGGPCVEASPALSNAGLAIVLPLETLRLLSDSPTLLALAERALPPLLGRILLGLPPLLRRLSPILSKVNTPSGRKRPASDQVSVTVASNAFLMRL
jgi:hypothetical protein